MTLDWLYGTGGALSSPIVPADQSHARPSDLHISLQRQAFQLFVCSRSAPPWVCLLLCGHKQFNFISKFECVTKPLVRVA